MLAELTLVLGGEVDLVVVGTGHRTIEHIAVVPLQAEEVVLCQIVERGIIARGGGVHVLARTVAVDHLVDGEVRTVLVGLVVVDALGVGETELQTLQGLEPAHVDGEAAVQGGVRGHRAAVVAVVLQQVEVIGLTAVALAVADTV